MKFTTRFGTYELDIRVGKYCLNNNLAISIDFMDEESGFMMPFASLTVNLDKKLPENVAYLDTNNFPEAEDFVEQMGIGKPTGRFGFSGYCCYPQYEFNL